MISLGTTKLQESFFLGFLQGINKKYTQETYDLLKNNSNTFTDQCAKFLTGKGIPGHIIDLPLEVLNNPMAAVIRDKINERQNQASAQSVLLFEPVPISESFEILTWDINRGKGKVLELNTQQEYNSCINAIDVCIIDVFADWCRPCQGIKPFVDALPSQYPGLRFFKVNF